MVFKCCVPGCKSKYVKGIGVKFHQFPREKRFIKLWLWKLKLQPQYINNGNKLVCSKHFIVNDYQESFTGLSKVLKPDSIPTKNLPMSSHERKLDNTINQQRIDRAKNRALINKNEEKIQDEQVNNHCVFEEEISKTHNIETQTTITFQTKSTQTVETNLIRESILFIALCEYDFKYYTGLNSTRFSCLFDVLNIKHTPFDKYLSKKDQLILTLIKFRQNFHFHHIGKLYGINKLIVRKIFVYFTNILYDHLKSMDFWSLRYEAKDAYTAIIDCSEIVTNQCKNNPEQNQVFFSQYKHRHTLKYLVGIDERGNVTYCSDVYGGSVSDQKIVQDSGFLDNLKEGDIILADRGFDISDILSEKGVALNIPPFLRGKEQLTEKEVIETRIIAHRRIHIERIIGLAKHNQILSGTFTSNLWPYGNKIVFVGNMLCNYKPNIV